MLGTWDESGAIGSGISVAVTSGQLISKDSVTLT